MSNKTLATQRGKKKAILFFDCEDGCKSDTTRWLSCQGKIIGGQTLKVHILIALPSAPLTECKADRQVDEVTAVWRWVGRITNGVWLSPAYHQMPGPTETLPSLVEAIVDELAIASGRRLSGQPLLQLRRLLASPESAQSVAASRDLQGVPFCRLPHRLPRRDPCLTVCSRSATTDDPPGSATLQTPVLALFHTETASAHMPPPRPAICASEGCSCVHHSPGEALTAGQDVKPELSGNTYRSTRRNNTLHAPFSRSQGPRLSPAPWPCLRLKASKVRLSLAPYPPFKLSTHRLCLAQESGNQNLDTTRLNINIESFLPITAPGKARRFQPLPSFPSIP